MAGKMSCHALLLFIFVLVRLLAASGAGRSMIKLEVASLGEKDVSSPLPSAANTQQPLSSRADEFAGPLGSAAGASDYLGCFQDSWSRALPYFYDFSDTEMTVDRCRFLAMRQGLPFYGLESGRECFAGYDVMRVLSQGSSTECTKPCSGNASQICGGIWALSVYSAPSTPPPPPAIAPGCFVGCFNDRADWRSLPDMIEESKNMTVESCRQLARSRGYLYFGVEAGTQCFAGNDLYRAWVNGNSAYCNWQCGGDPEDICGGDWSISIFHTYEPRPPPSPPSPSPPPPSLRKQDLVGCYSDSVTLRVLPFQLGVSEGMTVTMCRIAAMNQGLPLYGVEAGRECYGGYDIVRATSLGPSSRCDWPCTGNDCEVCGGDLAIVIYATLSQDMPSTPALPPPTPVYTSLPSYPPNSPAPPTYGAQPPPWWINFPMWPMSPDYTSPTEPSEPPVPPVYGSPPVPPQAASYLLPESLRPEAAYFDAAVGVRDYSDAVYDSDYALFWDEVSSSSEKPGLRLWLEGKCMFNRPRGTGTSYSSATSNSAQAVVPSILFDGRSCYGVVRNDNLRNWDANGAFTAVWIGRFSPQPQWTEQTFMMLSRTPSDFDQELYWTTDQTFLFSHATGLAADFTVAPPPMGQWTMEVLARSPAHDYESGTMSRYRYGNVDSGLSTWRVRADACSLQPDSMVVGADFRDGNKYFAGEVATVLMYNRALSEAEITALAAFYSPRFGWAPPPQTA